jgi:RimJ/RimL family protein N-acetyltransferase
MIIESRSVSLRDGRKILLKSPRGEDAELALDHLRTTHTESYRNLNSAAADYEQMTTEEEKMILENLALSNDKFMVMAFDENRIVGGLGIFGGGKGFTKFNARLGMSIRKEFQGVGLGREMILCAIEHARKFGFHRIELTVRTYNEAGIKLYERCGFRKVGMLRECAFVDEEFVDEYLYEIVL